MIMQRRREQGFALLIVLWSVVFLAFVMTQILANSRSAVTLAGALRASAQARLADDGAINTAILHAISPGNARWAADGTQHQVVIGAMTIDVTLGTLADKINPNLASAPLLAGLLRAVGEPGDQAAQIAQNIVAWRSPAPSQAAATALQQSYGAAGMSFGPPGVQFSDLSELTNVLGVTPALFAALAPHLSLFQTGDPNPATTDPIARQAIIFANATGMTATNYEGAPVITILACARGPAPLCRHAVVSIAGLGALTQYQIEQLGDGSE
jgi:general secretion pathway protein K